MATALGFRATDKEVFWAVVEGTVQQPILRATDKLVFPVSFDFYDSLPWCRERVRQLVDAYTPSVAAVRKPEGQARIEDESSRSRLRVEGVLLEALRSKNVPVELCMLANIAKLMSLGNAKDAKEQLSRHDCRGLDWKGYGPNSKEAILVGACVL